MRKHHSGLTPILCTMVMVLTGLGASAEASSPGEAVEGLWKYTNLTRSDGGDMPLTGIFLFKDGVFLQQSIFDGEPFDEQSAMAHAGPYSSDPDAVHLVAEQTISINPEAESPLSFRANTEHELSIDRKGDELTVVFGSGTIQELERIGPGQGEVYSLEDGALAFVDGFFILVQGNESESVSGYGTFKKHHDDILKLKVIRWAEGDNTDASNQRDVTLWATFDGQKLTLADGRTFQVVE